jgi:hypothetical protein
MTEPALIGASIEASGHPSECQEPVPGSVVSTDSHSVSVTVGGSTREIATTASADLSLPPHAHDYTDDEGCHQNESHTLDPSVTSSSITINGSPIYFVEDDVATDPTTGGSIDITSNPFNTAIDDQ